MFVMTKSWEITSVSLRSTDVIPVNNQREDSLNQLRTERPRRYLVRKFLMNCSLNITGATGNSIQLQTILIQSCFKVQLYIREVG
jgi:hypothetical protein